MGGCRGRSGPIPTQWLERDQAQPTRRAWGTFTGTTVTNHQSALERANQTAPTYGLERATHPCPTHPFSTHPCPAHPAHPPNPGPAGGRLRARLRARNLVGLLSQQPSPERPFQTPKPAGDPRRPTPTHRVGGGTFTGTTAASARHAQTVPTRALPTHPLPNPAHPPTPGPAGGMYGHDSSLRETRPDRTHLRARARYPPAPYLTTPDPTMPSQPNPPPESNPGPPGRRLRARQQLPRARNIFGLLRLGQIGCPTVYCRGETRISRVVIKYMSMA